METITALPKTVTLSEDAFWKRFKPLKNKIEPNSSYNGCMFETYGKELERVKKRAKKYPLTIWTISDNDGDLEIMEGFHFVNRLGYLITKVPAEANTQYIIKDPWISESNTEAIVSIDLSDVIAYENPDEVLEWDWIQRNASFSHVKNAENGVWEFLINLSKEFGDMPETLLGILSEAKEKGISYILFHQGT